jgi:hypothetical protein
LRACRTTSTSDLVWPGPWEGAETRVDPGGSADVGKADKLETNLDDNVETTYIKEVEHHKKSIDAVTYFVL